MNSNAKQFARFEPWLARSLALRAFNACETEINRHYWSFKLIAEFAAYIARGAQKEDPKRATATVFQASGPDAERIPTTVAEWIKAREDLENWLRLSAIVSATSYLEVYVRQVVRTALMSDPLCRFGALRLLDGTTLLKAEYELPYQNEVESVTKGDWNARCAAFQRLFGTMPSYLQDKVGDLEKIRNLRNRFAHGFGRDLDIPSPSDYRMSQSDKVSHKNLIEIMSILSKSAAAIDKLLLHNFICAFEAVHFYHNWQKSSKDCRDAHYDDVRALQRSFNRDLNCNVSQEFCKGLINYYRSI